MAKKLGRVTVEKFSSPEVGKEVAAVLKDALSQSSPGIYEALSSGLTRDEMIAKIVSITNRAEGYASTLTDTGLSIIGRERIADTAKDLGLTWYRYIGGVIDTSRDFCIERDGGYFHESEIEEWADDDWNGKIEGTDAENIFTFCGGWNCRHDLIPVMEQSVPTSDLERIAAADLDATKGTFEATEDVEVVTSAEEVILDEFDYTTNEAFDVITNPKQGIPVMRAQDRYYTAGKGMPSEFIGTPEEADMIRLYTSGEYVRMTEYLKGTEITSQKINVGEQYKAWDQGLTQSLNKLPSYNKTPATYRVESFNEERLKAYTSGREITNTNYWSTSPNDRGAFFQAEWGQSFFDDNVEFPNKLRIIIEVKEGSAAKDIRNFSRVRGEDEVLITRGTKFEFKSYDAKRKLLTLKEK